MIFEDQERFKRLDLGDNEASSRVRDTSKDIKSRVYEQRDLFISPEIDHLEREIQNLEQTIASTYGRFNTLELDIEGYISPQQKLELLKNQLKSTINTFALTYPEVVSSKPQKEILIVKKNSDQLQLDLFRCKNYRVIRADRYGLGIKALQQAYVKGECPDQHLIILPTGKKVVRPNTFAENLVAIVEDFETLYDIQGNVRTIENRKHFFGIELSSCSSIIYRDSGRIKISPISLDLIMLPSKFYQQFLYTNYNSVQGEEINFYPEKWKWNTGLSRTEFLNHRGWRAAVGSTKEGDEILKAYADIYYGALGNKRGLSFSLFESRFQGNLVPLEGALSSINIYKDYCSFLNGLYDSVFFLQLTLSRNHKSSS